jgi:hypothetical protein
MISYASPLLSSPFFTLLSYSALHFLVVNLCHIQPLFGFCVLSNGPRGSEPQQSFPFSAFLSGSRWEGVKLWGEGRRHNNKEETTNLNWKKKLVLSGVETQWFQRPKNSVITSFPVSKPLNVPLTWQGSGPHGYCLLSTYSAHPTHTYQRAPFPAFSNLQSAAARKWVQDKKISWEREHL